MFTVGTTVVCLLTVLTSAGGNILIQSSANAEGIVKGSGKDMSVVDFSKEADEHAWYGDYNKILINNDKCVWMKK